MHIGSRTGPERSKVVYFFFLRNFLRNNKSKSVYSLYHMKTKYTYYLCDIIFFIFLFLVTYGFGIWLRWLLLDGSEIPSLLGHSLVRSLVSTGHNILHKNI